MSVANLWHQVVNEFVVCAVSAPNVPGSAQWSVVNGQTEDHQDAERHTFVCVFAFIEQRQLQQQCKRRPLLINISKHTNAEVTAPMKVYRLHQKQFSDGADHSSSGAFLSKHTVQ